MHLENIMLLLPEIFLIVTAMGFLMVGVFQGNKSTVAITWSSALGIIITGLLLIGSIDGENYLLLHNMIIIDSFGSTLKFLILLGLLLTLGISAQYLVQERIARFEYPVLVLFAGIGMLFMVSANNFLSLYMALELQSFSLYILAAFHRNTLRSGEAAAKYFILGALSSGMLLFGISLIYGFTGSIDYHIVQATLSDLDMIPPGVTIGMVLILAALAFKVSAVPFHMWTPDVYQGAPTSVTAFFAIVPKVAAFALLIRLLFVPFEAAFDQWFQVLYLVALMSMVVGAFAGLVQQNIKRLIAYSSINNMGYALVGVLAASANGIGAVLLFLCIYMVMTAGTFAVILHMRRGGIAVEKISDLAGLSQNQPVLAYAMAALMFSMSGIPPLAGFYGKLFIFNAAVESELYILATLGILTSVVSAYYYLRIIKVMFFDEPADSFDMPVIFERRFILAIVMIFVLGFTLMPNSLYDSMMSATTSLFQ